MCWHKEMGSRVSRECRVGWVDWHCENGSKVNTVGRWGGLAFLVGKRLSIVNRLRAFHRLTTVLTNLPKIILN